MKIKFPLATSSWDENENNAMNRVIKSNHFSMGKEVFSFEKKFATFFNKKFAVMSNSGSSANLLMISSLFFRKKNSLKRGDEVIVPSVSWSTTYTPLQQYGLKIKFVDINIETLNFDIKQLKSAISKKTKLIFAVNLLGNSNEFNEIKKIIDKKNIILIEDNCESLGAKFEDRYLGSIGLMGSFSSFFSHHISTMEGGITITDDEELYHIMLSLRAHGWTRNLPQNNHVSGIKSENDFLESFNFVLPGYNLRPLEISGAIGIEQIKKIPKIIEGRRKNAMIFKSLFSNSKNFLIQKEIGESSWFGFSFIIKPESKISREKVLKKLKNNNIEFRPIVAGNFVKNPVIKLFDYEIHNDLPNSEILNDFGFFVGNHHYDLTQELFFLKETLKEFL
jgi:dTDP-4-amino-4,6-dideoxygalactose transaminase